VEFARVDAHELPQAHTVARSSPDMKVGSFPRSSELFGETMDVCHLLGENV